MEILKEDLFNILVDRDVLPGHNNYFEEVKEAIYDIIGLSEGTARNNIVDCVVKVTQQYVYKSNKLWKEKGRQKDRFLKSFAKTGGFLWNYISIPGPLTKENGILPTAALKKRRHNRPSPLHFSKGGRPTKEYARKKLRAKLYARSKLREAANDDSDLLLDTARVTSKNVDKDVSYVMNQMHKDPNLAAWLKDLIKEKKKG